MSVAKQNSRPRKGRKIPARIWFDADGEELAESGRLEDQLRSNLKLSWIKSCGDVAKVAGPNVGADATGVGVTFELRMVPGVERISP